MYPSYPQRSVRSSTFERYHGTQLAFVAPPVSATSRAPQLPPTITVCSASAVVGQRVICLPPVAGLVRTGTPDLLVFTTVLGVEVISDCSTIGTSTPRSSIQLSVAQSRRRPASFGWPRLSMDAQTAREEAEWPPDLSSGDLRAWRCDTDCLGDDRLEVRERSLHLVVRFQSCSGVTDGTLRFDENRRLSEIASKTTRRPT